RGRFTHRGAVSGAGRRTARRDRTRTGSTGGEGRGAGGGSGAGRGSAQQRADLVRRASGDRRRDRPPCPVYRRGGGEPPGRRRGPAESGTAQVQLRRGSDVHVHTEAQLGRVTWSGAVSGQSKDVEIGRGRAALDVEVLVGTAQITSD